MLLAATVTTGWSSNKQIHFDATNGAITAVQQLSLQLAMLSGGNVTTAGAMEATGLISSVLQLSLQLVT